MFMDKRTLEMFCKNQAKEGNHQVLPRVKIVLSLKVRANTLGELAFILLYQLLATVKFCLQVFAEIFYILQEYSMVS